LSGSKFTGNKNVGLGLNGVVSPDPSLIHNNSFENNKYGIIVLGPSDSEIKRNNFYKNTITGIESKGKFKGFIENNIFSENGSGILVTEESSPHIEGNTITPNQEVGIVIEANSKPYIRANTIQKNQIGIWVLIPANPSITNGNISNNVMDIRDWRDVCELMVTTVEKETVTLSVFGDFVTRMKVDWGDKIEDDYADYVFEALHDYQGNGTYKIRVQLLDSAQKWRTSKKCEAEIKIGN